MEREDRPAQAPPPSPRPEPPIPGQISLLELVCTCSEDCQAAVDEHVPECPVELELRKTFGF